MSGIINKDLEFNQGLEKWKELLIKELKLEEIGQKAHKKHIDLGKWQTLSLGPQEEVSLPSVSWKKAAQTYIRPTSHLSEALTDDLNSGVRLFFFNKLFFTSKNLEQAFSILSKHKDKADITCILLGNQECSVNDHGLKVIDENIVAIGRSAHDQGANTVHELGLMGYCLTLKLNKNLEEYFQGVFVDSRFFNNIAKIRAAKLIAHKILEVANDKTPIELIALNSYRDWTLFERYSNMLRNNTQVASALIAGADIVQTSGYQSVFEFESEIEDIEHNERSLRMSRNTSHILSLESMLGVVDDAAFGSFHLESLTQEYAKKGWEFMQELIQAESVKTEIQKVSQNMRSQRENNIHTRKHILAGLNDFADAKEKINLKATKDLFYRSPRSFENLRIIVQNLDTAPKVYIGVFGDYALLNPRLNFVKNFFEVLGLEVFDSEKGVNGIDEFKKIIESRSEDIIVYCAEDKDYEKISTINHKKNTYLAGKTEIKNCKNIYSGQDVYSALKELVEQWS